MTLWTNETTVKATGGKALGEWQAQRVEIDSRRVQPGDLFVALKGENFDGHDFVADAFKKGTVAAVISSPLPAGRGNFLIVPDTQKSLEDLGIYNRGRSKAKIIGVTGSVGKTSTKEMLRLALEAHGRTYASSGNFNNHIGTPLNLANLPPDAEFAVFEMGMNHAGEIAHLTKMVRPDVALVTNVEAVHMEFFKSIDDIADAKAEIFEGMKAGGVAVLNADNAQFGRLKAAAEKRGLRVVSFGSAESSDGYLQSYEATSAGGIVKARIMALDLEPYLVYARGYHFALASVGVLLAVMGAGGVPAQAAAKLAEFHEPEGRGNLVDFDVKGGAARMIDDSYNASPASMRAAFDKTADIARLDAGIRRHIAVLGKMLELGAESPRLHSELAQDLVRTGFKKIYASGADMRHLYEALPIEMRGAFTEHHSDLLPILRNELQPYDLVLIKGSHGSKMYELAQILRDASASAQDPVHCAQRVGGL